MPLLIRIIWKRKWQPTPVFLSGKFHGQRSFVGYSPWSHKELDMTVQSRMHSHCKIANIEQYFSNYKQEDWYSHIYIRISGWRRILTKLENWGSDLIGIERSFRTCTEQIKNFFFSFSTDDSKVLSVEETSPWLIYFVLLFIKNLLYLRYSAGCQVDRWTQI